MRLSQLRKNWAYMSETEKISLIEKTNERRLEAFEVKKRKKSVSKKRKKKKARIKKKHTTADGLLELMKKMTPEQRENFKLAALAEKKN